MFAQYSIKQKSIAFAVLMVLLLLASNKRSFRPTLNAYDQLKEVREKVQFMSTSSQNAGALRTEMDYFKSLLGEQHIAPVAAQQAILNFATKLSAVKITGISETHFSVQNGFNVITNQIELTGGYQELCKAIYDYEKDFDTSFLVSVNFAKTKKNNRKNQLSVTLIFQNYEKAT